MADMSAWRKSLHCLAIVVHSLPLGCRTASEKITTPSREQDMTNQRLFFTLCIYNLSISALFLKMSLSGASNFVAGDKDLRLHQLFDFNNAYGEAVETITPPADGLHGPPCLGSPFPGPFEDLHGQPATCAHTVSN